jgi:hypothetical protein
MARLFVALLVVAMLWTTAAAPSAFAQTGDKAAAEKALIDHERNINEAVANGDKGTFLALTAGDGVWRNGRWKRGGSFVPVTMFVEAFDQIKVTRWEIVNPHGLWIDPTTALVLYAWIGSGSFMNQPFAPTTIASTVWTKRGDKWVAVYHQESDAPKQ